MNGSHYFQMTDQGRVRSHNEDFCFSCVPSESVEFAQKGALFIIADGLGGLADGEIASKSAAEGVRNAFMSQDRFGGTSWLKDIIQHANQTIYQINRKRSPQNWMATTLTLSLFHSDHLYIGHVGDCRVYRVRGTQATCLTQDHTVDRHTLTRTVGIEPRVSVDTPQSRVLPGDVFLQCSDGLYSMVTEAELRRIVTSLEPAQACGRLIAMANERGGPDNITLQVVRIP